MQTNTISSFKTLDARDLGVILRKTHQSIKNDLSRAPHRLPPPIKTTGRRTLWLEHRVLEWLEAQIELPKLAKKMGAPTKAVRLAKALAAGGMA
jgi:hypothetical protein